MSCRVIHSSFAPSISARDAAHAAALLLHPSAWREGPAPERLERTLAEFQPAGSVYALDSGRNALRLALQALNVGPDDEVLLQAFTCVSVPGPALWLGARPVYVDILPETFNMDPDDLRRKITPNSHVIIMQHTFGLPADLEPILAVAKDHNLPVIEDCAHALGSTYQGRHVGTFGDAAIFSFGRDKVISSVFGGALVTNTGELTSHLSSLIAPLPTPPSHWILQQLLHPILAPLLRSTYFCGGRYAMRIAQELRFLSKALTAREKAGEEPPWPARRMPNALAQLAERQLGSLENFLTHRQHLAQHYTESLADVREVTLPKTPTDRTHGFLRYAIRVTNPAILHAAARRQGIILGDWYDTVVAPTGTDLRAIGYAPGSCPVAEATARRVINLPTSPTIGIPEADRVIRLVRSLLERS